MAAASKSFKGTGLRGYAQAAQRLLDIARALEHGQRRAEGIVDGAWVDVSMVQAAELRQSADYMADVISKLLAQIAA